MRVYYLDDGEIVLGELNFDTMIFTPDNLACGFSNKKIYDEDIGRTLFYSKKHIMNAKSMYDFNVAKDNLKREAYKSKLIRLIYKLLDWLSEKLK